MEFFNPFPNKPWFLHVYITSLLKTLWGKEKLLIASNFPFSHNVFYPFGELSDIFIKLEIVVFTLSVWKSLNFAFSERVKQFFKNPLLWNRWSDFEIISQVCSLGDPFGNCLQNFDLSINTSGE